MEQKKTAREAALLALTACERQGAWADGTLKKILRETGLDSREAGLATRLCFGVLQNRMWLDFHLSQFSSTSLDQLDCCVLGALRLGTYQMLCMDRVPVHAAVNESVNLARKYAKNPRAAGLVNGVLRALERSKGELAQPEDWSIRYSHPKWLVDALDQALGGVGTQALLAANNAPPPTVAQVNALRFSTEEVLSLLKKEGIEAQRHPWVPDCLLLQGTGNLEQCSAFQAGAFLVQDSGAKLAVLAAGPEPGMRVLDVCAAPGGKSFAAAIRMGDQGKICSCDIHPHKERLIQAGARRLGISMIRTAIQDGKKRRPEWENSFDLVLADVPCSGLGIIRKKPDIRYKAPKPLEGLPDVQRAILDNVSAYVRPGGVLFYATCTLLERENDAVTKDFLDRHSNFTLEYFQLPDPIGGVERGAITLWPHLHGTDGFYFAKLRRKA